MGIHMCILMNIPILFVIGNHSMSHAKKHIALYNLLKVIK